MLNSIEINDIIIIAKKAGNIIMNIYQKDFEIKYKGDNSPLTKADLASNESIINDLKKYNIPILSEEGKSISFKNRKDWEYYWCIDPLDGTKEFIKKNDEFTVNIALIHKNKPILGVVYAPALNDIYYAKKGYGAFKNGKKLPLEVNKKPEKLLRVVVSKSHLSKETEEFIDKLKKNTQKVEIVSKGSSLKIVMIAEGSADIYPRLGSTMEWDTTAADAIVREAGKMIYQFGKEFPLIYNKENLLNPWFVAR